MSRFDLGETTLVHKRHIISSRRSVGVRYLLRVIKEGKASSPVGQLAKVQAHFRIAKLLMNFSLKET